MNFNPLFIFGNAYNHPTVCDLVEKLDYDVLEFANIPEKDMLRMAIRFFLSKTQYTHFSYIAPDLHVHNNDVIMIKKDIEELNPEVISACCNVDHNASSTKIACCFQIPTYEFETRNYRWLAESQRQSMIEKGYPIHEFGFSSLAICMIRRDVLTQVDVCKPAYKTQAQNRWDNRVYGYAWDLNFSHWCYSMGIKNLVDLRIKLKHDRDEYRSQVGLKPPYIKYRKADSIIILKCEEDR